MTRIVTHGRQHTATQELNFEMSYLIARFGRRQALIAILKTFWKGKGRPPDPVVELSNHLRRDVGLPQLAHPASRWWGQF